MAALYLPMLDNLVEKKVVLNNCTFGTRGIEIDVLRNELLAGRFEQFERSAVLEYVSPHLPVVELGGCLGVVSCITNRLLQHPKRHVVVEANPRVVPLMKANRKRNKCHFQILNRAIAYGKDVVEFSATADFASNSLREPARGSLVKVKTISLDEIRTKNDFDRFTLICDIEGHECELVERESDALGRADLIILETHARMIGEERNQVMLDRLTGMGFRVVAQEASVFVLKNESQVSAS